MNDSGQCPRGTPSQTALFLKKKKNWTHLCTTCIGELQQAAKEKGWVGERENREKDGAPCLTHGDNIAEQPAAANNSPNHSSKIVPFSHITGQYNEPSPLCLQTRPLIFPVSCSHVASYTNAQQFLEQHMGIEARQEGSRAWCIQGFVILFRSVLPWKELLPMCRSHGAGQHCGSI